MGLSIKLVPVDDPSLTARNCIRKPASVLYIKTQIRIRMALPRPARQRSPRACKPADVMYRCDDGTAMACKATLATLAGRRPAAVQARLASSTRIGAWPCIA